ncbi:hypothetical protein JTB14_033205 [Gonioctena quinquepunctata]|nr:hypothetical protein JTB14_033205 [Gonioctena quinquepunctata]
MSILDQSRALPLIQGMPPVSQPMMPPHNIDGPPNSDVLLALLARNKALEGESVEFVWKYFYIYLNYLKLNFESDCIALSETIEIQNYGLFNIDEFDLID